jgi:two-component system response regulator LytT
MIKIAIVEDYLKDAELLMSFLEKFKLENNAKHKSIEFKIAYFENAVMFLDNYNPIYDIVFFDIQMPYLNGMDAAVKLRELDPAVQLVFFTNLPSFAVHGYSVNAADFLVKPVNYYSFSVVMSKLVKNIGAQRDEIVLKTSKGIRKVLVQSITYIEVRDHLVTYHTLDGDIELWGSLKEQEKILPSEYFVRCHNCYLVNIKYVDEIDSNFVQIYDAKIPISRARKQDFMQKVLDYYKRNF